MHVIISELDANSSVRVKAFWHKLYQSCGLKAIYDLPIPHITWTISESLDVSRAQSLIANLAARSHGLTTYVFGLGLFAGTRPVFYLPVVKSQEMIDVHNQIWDLVQVCCDNPNLYYSPQHWLPHITLAINDLSRENLACAIETVAFEPIEMTITTDNLIIVVQEGDFPSEVLSQYRFGG